MEATKPDPKTTKLRIEWLPTDQLSFDSRNPRKHSDRQVKQIARSIQSFGFNVPVLVNSANRVIAGHGRVAAAKKLQLPQIPVLRLDHLTEAQSRAFMIADNRLTETSVWDDRLLAEALKGLAELELDFSIEATGFTVGEIDLRIEGLGLDTNDSDDRADALPPPPQDPVGQIGNLWLLGEHRVYCGNALDAHAYEILMQGRRAAMSFSDSPYNLKIDGHVSGLGKIHHREFAMAAGELDAVEFTSFLTRCFALMAKHSVDGSMHFACMDWRHMGELLEAGRLTYTELKNVCVWVKDNGGMGSLYRSQHELVFVFKHGSASHRNNVQLGRYGRNRTNVWHYPCANTFSRQSDEGHLAALHPTIKPVAMVADAILDCSARGDVVLDPFLGSGTTLIAAERVGRRCYGIEIDPLYVDTIIRRWQAFTGTAAIHAVTGKRFDDLAGEAEISS